ncbi:DUF5753 domain-containing protein, partial [Saccharothrix sp. MB29]|nr:DUF5753 domain-containing protein [Saccharothrix sp. MB29]
TYSPGGGAGGGGGRGGLPRHDPVRYTAVIGEGVLSQRFGDPEVMREQLSHLLKMGAEPHVDLRVMPSATDWHPGHVG